MLKRHGTAYPDHDAVVCRVACHHAITGAALWEVTSEGLDMAQARRFVCIADESKRVPVLGRFPLPVEVIPMAAAPV